MTNAATSLDPFVVSPNAPRASRFGAFIIDGLVLGSIGMGLGWLFGPTFTAMGPWARLVGLPIALLYFSLFTGPLGRGATPGQRLLHLRVRRVDGTVTSGGWALLRSGILIAPWLFNGWAVVSDSRVLLFVSFIVIGSILSQLYLVLFNSPARRGLHDLAAGTMVVRDGDSLPPGNTPRSRIVIAAVLSLLPLAVSAAIVGTAQIASLVKIQQAVMASTHAHTVSVSDTRQTVSGNPVATTTLSVVVSVRVVGDRDSLARAIALAVLHAAPEMRSRDQIAVTLQEGYDIMIWRITRNQSLVRRPREWEETAPQQKAA